MAHLNFEFKAHTADVTAAENKLLSLSPIYKGEDHQIDTYFNTPKGRLKLREGNIENSLIYYERKDTAGAKQSDILLYEHQPNNTLKQILTTTNGIKTIVDKKRKIYFIGNVKFHFDTVAGLGNFIEVEAIDSDGTIGIDKLTEQCNYYASFLGVQASDYIAVSYSDLIMAK